MFTDPISGSQCMVVGKIVTEKWQEREYELQKENQHSPKIDPSHLFIRLARVLFRAARREQIPANAAVAERTVHDTAVTDY